MAEEGEQSKVAEEVQESSSKVAIMVAVDESECSTYALNWALDNLRHCFLDTPLTIFTAQPAADYDYLYGVANQGLMDSVRGYQKTAAAAIFAKAKEICASHGVTTKTVTAMGDPKEAICEAVEKFNINLLVVGNHGRGVISRAFLGSVSNYCVHHAKCPVLVVRKAA